MDYVIYLTVIIFSVLIGIIAALLWGRKIMQRYFTNLYAVRNPNGIEELCSVTIGGVEQWFHIRGQNKNNPILLFIHGGPGWTHIGWYDAIQRPWENYFSVVQWDQRQTGKSYQSMTKIGHTISHGQYLSDAEEMIRHIRERYNQKKIFLMATSYGSYLGMHMAKKHPDWLYAYIGVGQVVKMKDHISVEYDLLMDYAKKNKMTALVEKLNAMQPYPDPENIAKSFYGNAKMLMDEESLIGKAYPDGMDTLFSIAAISKCLSPLYNLRDIYNSKFGQIHDFNHPFAQEFMEYDLPKELGEKFDVPIIFLTGSHDYHVAYSLTDSWFQKIDAPYKQQVWFKDSAHVPFQTEPAEFVIALKEKVLPLALSAEKQ